MTSSSPLTYDVKGEGPPTTDWDELLWLPYIILTVVFITFLAVNFWCYHKRRQEIWRRRIRHKQSSKRMRFAFVESESYTECLRGPCRTVPNLIDFDVTKAEIDCVEQSTEPNSGLLHNSLMYTASVPKASNMCRILK